MTEEDKHQEQRTLGNDEIHVQYRNKQDLVRQAIDYARSLADDSASPDGQISMPVQSFRTIVEALRMTYKTLGETIHQDLTMTSSAMPLSSSDQGTGPTLAPERAKAEVIVRFNAGKPRAREALQQAQLYSEYYENAYRNGDQITIPIRAFQIISAALMESNDLMMDILREPKLLGELAATMRAPRPDHGDYGASWDPWNSGDWLTAH